MCIVLTALVVSLKCTPISLIVILYNARQKVYKRLTLCLNILRHKKVDIAVIISRRVFLFLLPGM